MIIATIVAWLSLDLSLYTEMANAKLEYIANAKTIALNISMIIRLNHSYLIPAAHHPTLEMVHPEHPPGSSSLYTQ